MKAIARNRSTIPLTCAAVNLSITLSVIILSGSPYDMLHKFNATDIIPPIWIFNIFTTIWAFIIGYTAGYVIYGTSHIRQRIEISLNACKGGIFFVSFTFLYHIWYPLFFIAERPLISLLISIFAIVCAAVCSFFWTKISGYVSLTIAAYALWLSYISFVNLSLIFHN